MLGFGILACCKKQSNKMEIYNKLEEKNSYFTCKNIETVGELDNAISQLNNKHYVFRGVRDAKYMCYTSAQVNFINRKVDPKQISQDYLDRSIMDMISQVKNNSFLSEFVKDITDDKTDMQILGLLQHYGFGTTILDFTYSFNEAVFFALDGAIYEDKGDINDYLSIYYFDIEEAEHNSAQSIFAQSYPNLSQAHQEATRRYGNKYSGVSEQTKQSFSEMPYFELCKISRGGLSIAGGMGVNARMNDVNTGISFVYNLASDRLHSQKGLFKLYSRVDVAYEVGALEWYSGMRKKLYCMNIHKSLIPVLKERYLVIHGITSATIYPKTSKSIRLTKALLKLPIAKEFRPRTKPQLLNFRTWKKYEKLYKKRMHKRKHEYNDTLFPDLHPKDQEVLYIIGNGFDISHDIESRYSNFKQWVQTQGNTRLIGLMDTFFSNKRDLWCDVETALGEYDEENIFDYCRPDEDIDYDHMMRSVAAVEDAPDWLFKPVLDEFLESFSNWVDAIDITMAKRKLSLGRDSKYLTFNYTETLETVYGIPGTNVKHIHGNRLVKGDEYIIGHNNLKSDKLHVTTDGELYFEQDTKNKIIGWMNGVYKDTQNIIRQNLGFFNSLSVIKHIVVIGHSLYDVDWAYFDEVVKHVGENALWIFHYFSKEDADRINAFIAHSGIINYRLV